MQTITKLISLFIFTLLIPGFGVLADEMDVLRDPRIYNYKLSIEKIQAYNKFSAELKSAENNDPQIKKEQEADPSESEGAKTLAEFESDLEKHAPKTLQLAKHSGLSTLDLIAIPTIIVQSFSTGFEQFLGSDSEAAKLLPKISPHNEKFIKEHQDELKVFSVEEESE